jgi:hypothetical protein
LLIKNLLFANQKIGFCPKTADFPISESCFYAFQQFSFSRLQNAVVRIIPISSFQKETQPFNENNGQWYGEVTLTIEPNRELCRGT